MKRLLHFVGVVMILLTLTGTLIIGHYVISGYRMYQDAVFVQSVEEKVNEIRHAEDYITFDEISEEFLDELIWREDRNFYRHSVIDLMAVMRAAWHDLQEGRYVEGGSTITQQLAKNLYFTGEKRLERKIAELFVAFDLEQLFTKEEILELYCNVVYFGEGCYGIDEAARHYYGVTADGLDEEQAQALVYTLKCPVYYNPNARLAAGQ